jgi:hypothetical protein
MPGWMGSRAGKVEVEVEKYVEKNGLRVEARQFFAWLHFKAR